MDICTGLASLGDFLVSKCRSMGMMKKNFDVRTTTTIISSFKQVVAIFMAALRQKLGWHSRLWREGSSKTKQKIECALKWIREFND